MEIISKRVGKIVEIGQTSLAVPMRGEIIDLGLDKGDSVSITHIKGKIIIEKV